MRKLRTLLIGLCIALLVSPIFAVSNQQKIYSLDSDIYTAIQVLYISQGLSLPSTTGPYSQAELRLMLEKLKPETLKGSLSSTYDYVVQQLNIEPKIQGKGIGLSWNFDANLEAYYHTDTTNFVGRETWRRGSLHQKPLLAIGLETWPAEHFYGYSELSVGNVPTLATPFGSAMISSNVIVVPPAVASDIDLNFPYRAFVAGGGDHWSFQIGRDRLNWGAGATGNLMLSDTFKYHNMARITTFSDKFKYTFVTSFFPHPQNFFGSSGASLTGHEQHDPVDGLYMFMSHRLEWRMLADKLGLTVTESIMYHHVDGELDLRVLNPAMFFHNYYIRNNANSILGLEMDYTPVRNINIYGQFAMDEFAIPGLEPIPSETSKGFPLAFGYLAGIKGVAPLKKTVGYGSLEFAYTDPYLYLRYSDISDPSSSSHDPYGLNYVGYIREFTGRGVDYHARPLGYTYGNDALVVNFNGGVKAFGKWNVAANLFYMAHGTFDLFTIWRQTGGSSDSLVSTPTSDGSDSIGNYNDSTYASRNAVSHTLVAGINGSYQLSDSLLVFGQVDYITIKNYKNKSGDSAGDVQLTLGASYQI